MFQEGFTSPGTGKIGHDLALLRLDYPVTDLVTGLGVLSPKGFNKTTLMPICLPPSKNFKDAPRVASAVGLGLTAERGKSSRCFTDGNGPVVFQRCSWAHVPPENMNETIGQQTAEYPCIRDDPTPSASNKVCQTLHEAIHDL